MKTTARMRRARAWVCVVVVLVAAPMLAVGCGDETAPPPPPPSNPNPTPPPASQPQAGLADAGADGGDGGSREPANLPPLPTREFAEGDFAETDRSRDPFRTFVNEFNQQAQGRVSVQRNVLVDRYALEELKLLGVVTRGATRALLADPTGLGWVAKVGDYIGKAELVHSGGPTGVDVAINWRVDRIRDDEVVFVREDASHPEIPPSTRVLSLRPTEEGRPGVR